MSALVTIIAVLILGPIVYAGSIWYEGRKNGDKTQMILGIVAVAWVILTFVWIFAFKCGRVF